MVQAALKLIMPQTTHGIAQDYAAGYARWANPLVAPEVSGTTFFRNLLDETQHGRFLQPLDSLVSPEEQQIVRDSTNWFLHQLDQVTDRQFSLYEPVVVPGKSHMTASYVAPFVKYNESFIHELGTARDAGAWRRAIQDAEPGTPPYFAASTLQSLRYVLAATQVHELTHAVRGVLLSPAGNRLALGIRLAAFGQAMPGFSLFAEGAATLMEGLFFRESKLIQERDWFTSTVKAEYSRWPEMRALESKPSADHASKLEELFDLFRRVDVIASSNGDLKRRTSKFTQHDEQRQAVVQVGTGYPSIHYGFENLALEIYRDRAKTPQDAIATLRNLLLKCELESKSKGLFKEIKDLAVRDIRTAPPSSELDDVKQFHAYLKLFHDIRPGDIFDCTVFQAFTEAGTRLPQGEVAKFRSDLASLYFEAVKDEPKGSGADQSIR